jgi:internalin A
MRTLYLSRNKFKELAPVKDLTKLWSLYLEGNELSDIQQLAGLKNLSSLELTDNKISDLTPLKEMTELRFLMLEKNQITDLGVLIEMAKKDAEGEKRFAPFWQVYLSGNPLSDEAKNTQLPELKKHAREVKFE